MKKKRQRPKKRRILTKDRNQIIISADEMKALEERIDSCDLSDEDKKNIFHIIDTVEAMNIAIDEKRITIRRLLNIFFGKKKTEKIDKVLNKSKEKEENKEEKKGTGRNGSDAYKGAKRVKVPHPELKSGDKCPLCLKGRVYLMGKPSPIVCITGSAPLSATIYECECLRCNLCQERFTAPSPEGIGEEKFDEKAKALLAILKYGSGMPYYRIEKLHDMFEIPLPDSTQWDLINGMAGELGVLYEEFLHQAAFGSLYYIDDTNVKILDLKSVLDEAKNKGSPKRKGLFTTGILCEVGDHQIGLYFSGNRHAGENLNEVLSQRSSDMETPLRMNDGLSRNTPKNAETIESNCNAHARRYFVKIVGKFPDEAIHVIEEMAKIYKNDREAKEREITPKERLLFHQEKSSIIMSDLKEYLEKLLTDKKVEPNSSLGKAISYMLNRWENLTRFLEIEGAPLDNNLCEQMLKRVILNRKNALFYKTQHGAYVGDMMMSIIHTCCLNHVNPFDYFVAVLKNSKKVAEAPSDWMPWNYKKNLSNEISEPQNTAAA